MPIVIFLVLLVLGVVATDLTVVLPMQWLIWFKIPTWLNLLLLLGLFSWLLGE